MTLPIKHIDITGYNKIDDTTYRIREYRDEWADKYTIPCQGTDWGWVPIFINKRATDSGRNYWGFIDGEGVVWEVVFRISTDDEKRKEKRDKCEYNFNLAKNHLLELITRDIMTMGEDDKKIMLKYIMRVVGNIHMLGFDDT